MNAIGDAMERSATVTDVMLIDEVARALKITPKQIRRLERRGAFPIPRPPKLDRHPRYARCLVERFAAGEMRPLVTRRRRIARNGVSAPERADSTLLWTH